MRYSLDVIRSIETNSMPHIMADRVSFCHSPRSFQPQNRKQLHKLIPTKRVRAERRLDCIGRTDVGRMLTYESGTVPVLILMLML